MDAMKWDQLALRLLRYVRNAAVAGCAGVCLPLLICSFHSENDAACGYVGASHSYIIELTGQTIFLWRIPTNPGGEELYGGATTEDQLRHGFFAKDNGPQDEGQWWTLFYFAR